MDGYYGVPIIRNLLQKIVVPKDCELKGFYCIFFHPVSTLVVRVSNARNSDVPDKGVWVP